jgi:hypothetical protein
MPAFQKISKEEISKHLHKYMKKKKFVMSNQLDEFFQKFGMHPRPSALLEILKLAFEKTTLIEAMIGFIPEEINPAILKGVCYYDMEKKIAYFSDIVDIALLKMLSDQQIRKIIQ